MSIKLNLEARQIRIDNPEIVEYDPDRHGHLADQLDEMDSEVLMAVERSLAPLTNEDFEPQKTSQTAEQYWNKYSVEHPVYMILDGDTVAAYTVLAKARGGWVDTMSVSAIVVRPQYRGNALAQQLLAFAKKWGKKNRFKHLIYRTQWRNTASRRTAEKAGLQPFDIGYFDKL